jgi:hypothetical protein
VFFARSPRQMSSENAKQVTSPKDGQDKHPDRQRRWGTESTGSICFGPELEIRHSPALLSFWSPQVKEMDG